MIKINKVKWLNKEAKEAEVYLTDKEFDIVCFAHPFCQKIGDEVLLPLYTMNAKMYMLSNIEEFSAEKIGENFEYKISAQVTDKHNNQVRVGEFIIQLDNPLPGDVEIDNYLSFLCERIDVY